MSIGRHRLSSPLELTLAKPDDTVLTLTAHGLIDAETVDELDEALQVILAQPGLTQLLLDFGPLTSIDSAGIAALVTAHQSAQRRGIALTVVNCGAVVRRALEVTGLYGHLIQGRIDGQRGQATAAPPQPPLPGPCRTDHHAHDRQYATPYSAAAATALPSPRRI
jgi:anti-sigma B factor antagonist